MPRGSAGSLRHTIDFPRITVKQFRTAGGKIIRDRKRLNSLEGHISWLTSMGAKVKAVYDFKLLGTHGYLDLRYNHPSQPHTEIDYRINLVPVKRHYGHTMWSFQCPKCNKQTRTLFYIEDPHFQCRICGKLESGRRIKKYKEMKYTAQWGTPYRKLMALEKLIRLKENLRRSNPKFRV